MPGIPRPVVVGPVQQPPVRLVLAGLDDSAGRAGLGNGAAECIGVQVADRGGVAGQRAADLGQQAAGQIRSMGLRSMGSESLISSLISRQTSNAQGSLNRSMGSESSNNGVNNGVRFTS